MTKGILKTFSDLGSSTLYKWVAWVVIALFAWHTLMKESAERMMPAWAKKALPFAVLITLIVGVTCQASSSDQGPSKMQSSTLYTQTVTNTEGGTL